MERFNSHPYNKKEVAQGYCKMLVVHRVADSFSTVLLALSKPLPKREACTSKPIFLSVQYTSDLRAAFLLEVS